MYNVHGSFVGQQTARGEQRQEFRNCGDCCSDWLYTTLQALAEESSIVSTSSMALECLHYTNFVSRFCVFCLSHVHSFLSLFLYIPRYIFWWAVAPFYTKQKISYKISLLGMPFFFAVVVHVLHTHSNSTNQAMISSAPFWHQEKKKTNRLLPERCA